MWQRGKVETQGRERGEEGGEEGPYIVVFLGGDGLRWGVKFIWMGREQDGVDKGTPYGNLWRVRGWG